MYTDDPVRDFHQHDHKQNKEWMRLPVCDNPKCQKVINDDYYFEIDGEILCEKCMNERYRKNTEDYKM